MCVVLTRGHGFDKTKKCTSDEYGRPYLVDNYKIAFPFDSSNNYIRSIRIIFEGDEPGQVQSLIVEGITPVGKKSSEVSC